MSTSNVSLRIERVDGTHNRFSIKAKGKFVHLRVNKDLNLLEIGQLLEKAGKTLIKYVEEDRNDTLRSKFNLNKEERREKVNEV